MVIFTLFLFSFKLEASNVLQPQCLLGKNETELTIQRVMLNYGKYLMPAEMILDKAKLNYSISDQEFEPAILKLSQAIDCTQKVILNPNEKVLPQFLDRLTISEKEETIKLYLYYMTNFVDYLLDFQKELIKQSALKAEERNFTFLETIRKDMNKYIDKAHKRTMQYR